MPLVSARRITIGIKNKIRVISLVILLIPVYFFTIGDSYGIGFQTPFFRYQEIFLGSFLIFISNDIYNIITGFFQGAQIPVVLLWCLGSFILIVNNVLVFVDTDFPERIVRRSGVLILISGIFFLISLIIHYGPLFHNTSGAAIPLGLLLIFLIGIWMYRFDLTDEYSVNAEEPVQ